MDEIGLTTVFDMANRPGFSPSQTGQLHFVHQPYEGQYEAKAIGVAVVPWGAARFAEGAIWFELGWLLGCREGWAFPGFLDGTKKLKRRGWKKGLKFRLLIQKLKVSHLFLVDVSLATLNNQARSWLEVSWSSHFSTWQVPSGWFGVVAAISTVDLIVNVNPHPNSCVFVPFAWASSPGWVEKEYQVLSELEGLPGIPRHKWGISSSECCFAMFRLYSWVLGWGDEGWMVLFYTFLLSWKSGAALDDGGSPRVKPTLLLQHYERFALQKVGELDFRRW